MLRVSEYSEWAEGVEVMLSDFTLNTHKKYHFSRRLHGGFYRRRWAVGSQDLT